MAWSTPRTWVVAEILTAANMNTFVRDQQRFLKGIDGVTTLDSGLIITSAAGNYVQHPSLTTTQRDALTAVNGMVIYNSTLAVFQRREAGAWVSYNDLAQMTIASIAQGDIFFRGATLIERLAAAAAAGYFLKSLGTGANPAWQLGDLSARAYNSGALTLVDGVGLLLTWDTEEFDTDTIHDNATNNSRLTCKTAGKYLVCVNAHFNSAATASTKTLQISGSMAAVQGGLVSMRSSETDNNLFVAAIVNMAVNEWVTATATLTGVGGTIVTNRSASWFGMARLGV
mgnify:CR=1 FL=1